MSEFRIIKIQMLFVYLITFRFKHLIFLLNVIKLCVKGVAIVSIACKSEQHSPLASRFADWSFIFIILWKVSMANLRRLKRINTRNSSQTYLVFHFHLWIFVHWVVLRWVSVQVRGALVLRCLLDTMPIHLIVHWTSEVYHILSHFALIAVLFVRPNSLELDWLMKPVLKMKENRKKYKIFWECDTKLVVFSIIWKTHKTSCITANSILSDREWKRHWVRHWASVGIMLRMSLRAFPFSKLRTHKNIIFPLLVRSVHTRMSNFLKFQFSFHDLLTLRKSKTAFHSIIHEHFFQLSTHFLPSQTLSALHEMI